MELKPWAIDSRAQGKFRPWGILGRGGGGCACVRGGRSQNWCQAAQPNQSPVQSSQSSPSREQQLAAHAHNRRTRDMHNPLVLRQCHVVARVVSIGSREGREREQHRPCDALPGRGRTGQNSTKCARYSQLIRIIDCQACGTEGTEWRRRGPLSLCVRPLSPVASASCLSLCACACACVCICVRVCVPPRAYRDEKNRSEHGHGAGWASCS